MKTSQSPDFIRRTLAKEQSGRVDSKHKIRLDGPPDQYEKFDEPRMVGKLISAKIYQPGATAASRVKQLIITKDFLDASSQHIIDQLTALAGRDAATFEEYGAWQIYAASGRTYASDQFLKGDSSGIPHAICLAGLRKVLGHIEQSEGPGFKIDDVDFFHTHLERGELFNEGDQELSRLSFNLLRRRMVPGGVVATYAIPTKGNNLFRQAQYVRGHHERPLI